MKQKKKTDKSYSEIIKNNKHGDDIKLILTKIKNNFLTLYPELYSKYYGWCSIHNINIPQKDYLNILQINNTKTLIKFLLLKNKKLITS